MTSRTWLHLDMAALMVEVPEDLAANLQPDEVEQIAAGLIGAGVGVTMARDFVYQGIEVSRRGLLANTEIERMNADGCSACRPGGD
jgi:hypothetical protein